MVCHSFSDSAWKSSIFLRASLRFSQIQCAIRVETISNFTFLISHIDSSQVFSCYFSLRCSTEALVTILYVIAHLTKPSAWNILQCTGSSVGSFFVVLLCSLQLHVSEGSLFFSKHHRQLFSNRSISHHMLQWFLCLLYTVFAGFVHICV